jgi:hypothetical protein
MADPRAQVAALRDLGLKPPARPSPTIPDPPPRPPDAGIDDQTRQPAPRESARPARGTTAKPSKVPSAVPVPALDSRRSRSTTVYLAVDARRSLEEAQRRDPDATVADLMLAAVRAQIVSLRAHHVAPSPPAADDPLPIAVRPRRRRRVNDGRPVPVRFSPAELAGLNSLAAELGESVSSLISAALSVSQDGLA